MKIFVSWSGEVSHRVALILRDWLGVVLPYAKVWVSSEDIAKGSRWASELTYELESTNCGIICVTPDNINEPWLNFEAGALSKVVRNTQVHPFLLRLSVKDLSGPLSQFQATEFQRSDLQKLVEAINSGSGNLMISKRDLDRNFEVCWADVSQRVTTCLAAISQGNGEQVDRSHGSVGAHLKDDDVKVLQAFLNAQHGRLYAAELGVLLRIHEEKAKYLLENLTELGFLNVAHNYVTGSSWFLSPIGRAELVRRGVI